MEQFISTLSGFLGGVGPFLILLGLLIFVHELGHFLVAKYFDVRVEVFSLGFGKKILQFKRGDTNYCISLIPLGGYVKMYGDDPTADIPSSERRHSFLHKPVGQRIAVVLAGPLMNLFFAFFLFLLIGLVGEPQPSSQIGDIAPQSAAHTAGFRSGDKVLQVNGKPVRSWNKVRDFIESSANQELKFLVERDASTERAEFVVTPRLGANENILSLNNQVGQIEGLDLTALAPVVGVLGPDTLAAKAGLKSLDLILSINGREVLAWRHLASMIQEEVQRDRMPLRLEVQSYTEDNAPIRIVELHAHVQVEDLSDAHGAGHEGFKLAPSLEALGLESSQLYLWKIKRGSPADLAGLKAADRVLAVAGQPVTQWSQVISIVKDYKSDSGPIRVEYRRDGQVATTEVVPEMTSLMTAQGKEEQRQTIGIVSAYIQTMAKPIIHRADSAGGLILMGLKRTWESTVMVVMSIVRLINGDVSAKNVGGIISIGRFANQSFEAGFSTFVKMMALISINLFLLNLLPVPVLDGGHLVFYSIELLKGSPLSMRKMEIAQQVGLVLLMSLMVFALFNDITNWLNAW